MLILRFLNYKFLRLGILLSIALALGACHQEILPNYWLCEGSSTQEVYTKSNQLEKEFHGHDPVLLEIFDGKVFQFFSTAVFGLYWICPSENHLLKFSKLGCDMPNSRNDSRLGVLNKISGNLVFDERRITSDRVIIGKSMYTCKYIGHTYQFSVFNHVVNEK